MARPRQKNLVTRLADVGEEAINRLADVPGGDRVMGAMTSMRERMDDMQKKLRGLDALDRRVATLERRLDKLEGKTAASTRRVASTTAKRSTASRATKGTTPKAGTRRRTGES
jgi:hypothetical protein